MNSCMFIKRIQSSVLFCNTYLLHKLKIDIFSIHVTHSHALRMASVFHNPLLLSSCSKIVVEGLVFK